jgi:hypothetical protein
MKFLISVLAFVLLLSCGTKVEIEKINTFTEKYPFNYIGLVGEQSDTAYVEVFFSEASTNNSNEISHRWVKLPTIIGGGYTNVIFDSIVKKITGSMSKTAIKPIGRVAHISYLDNGSHFMKIINHSSKPIQYFIVGNHDLKTYDLDKLFSGPYTEVGDSHKTPPTSITTDLLPEVFYNGTPVKYLLFPNLKPKTNLYKIHKDAIYSKNGKEYYGFNGIDTLFFENNRSGNLIINSAWSIENILSLYQAEYNNSIDTVLTITYLNKKDNITVNRISNGAEKYYSETRQNILKPSYYGVIPAGSSIISSEKIPFITHVKYEYYNDKP